MLVLAALVLAIGPWTGPDVATATAAPVRKRVVVQGTASGTVRLTTGGLPHGWVAAWCTSRVCTVGRTTVDLDRRGAAVVELTVVPDDAARAPWPVVRVTAARGGEHTSATFVARPR